MFVSVSADEGEDEQRDEGDDVDGHEDGWATRLYSDALGDDAAARQQQALLGRLGKHKMEKSCLYISRLDQVDMDVLEEIIANNVAEMNRLYPPA